MKRLRRDLLGCDWLADSVVNLAVNDPRVTRENSNQVRFALDSLFTLSSRQSVEVINAAKLAARLLTLREIPTGQLVRRTIRRDVVREIRHSVGHYVEERIGKSLWSVEWDIRFVLRMEAERGYCEAAK